MPAGYTITEELYRGSKQVVCRAVNDADGSPVVIKSLLAEVPTEDEVARVRREYSVLTELDIEGVVKARDLLIEADSLDLVLEDTGGLTLAEHADARDFDLGQRLEIAAGVAAVLGDLHREGIVHKDVTPRNLLVGPETGAVTLIDFSIASREGETHHAATHPRRLEGTPAYLSPEQTGRMNRPVDYRCDFYSLGITLFELLTGRLPFEAQDAMGLVHCHIAVVPPAVSSLRPEVPEAVSSIVAKLLQKAPEDRYQSAAGIVHDLRLCHERLRGGGRLDDFVAGSKDIVDRFLLPRRLYGRREELGSLMAAFKRVGDGARELVLVHGHPGIGKSSLVREMQKPVTGRRGYFVSGKFDQLRRTIPYTAIAAAIRELVHQLLTESDESLADWRMRLLESLGANGKLVVDIVPDIERIIGEQPELEELTGPAARDRFNTTFLAFVRVFCRREHPLVLFLDDLQWADEASLTMMAEVLSDDDTRFLLLIGAYRDTEVDAAHPLVSALESIQEKSAAPADIGIGPLTSVDIVALLSDTLHAEPDQLVDLERLVSDKTGGNPFFLRQFLITLWHDGHLKFDLESNRWTWDVSSIAATNTTENVADLMVQRLEALPESALDVVRLAACVGNQFTLRTLEGVQPTGSDDPASALQPALDAGLLFVDRIAAPGETGVSPSEPTYRFLHDRVHEAAYALLGESEKQDAHLHIGRALLAGSNEPGGGDRLFETVDHLNVGRPSMRTASEVRSLAALNLRAASRALAATAYDAAIDYTTDGLGCVGEDVWAEDYELAKALHRIRAIATYSSGAFEESQRVIDGMMAKLETPVERAELQDLLVVQRTLLGEYADAIDTAVEALALIGVEVPTDGLDEALQRELDSYRTLAGDRPPSDFLELPDTTSAETRVALKLLGSVCPLCYIANPPLYRVAAAKMVNLSLASGQTSDSAFGYAFFGLVHSSFLHDYDTAYELGRLALDLSEKYSSASQRCRSAHTFCAFINHWKRPLSEFGPINSDGFHAGVQSGELQFAGYHRYNRSLCLFHAGVNLVDLEPELEELARFSRRTRNEHATDPIVAVQRVVMDLMSCTPRPGSFDAEADDDSAFLLDLVDRNAIPALCHYNVIKSQAHFLYGQLDAARRCARDAAENVSFISGHFSVAVQNFYESLVLTAIAGDDADDEGDELLVRVEENQARMGSWSESCPANFKHKYLLVEAELSRLRGDGWRAAELYDQAIEEAGRNEYRHEEALARELAAKFWLARDRRKVAAVYMREAHHGYRLWGATRKADLLESTYETLLTGMPTRVSRSAGETTPYLTLVSSTGVALDFSTVMKAARTISAEIDPDALADKLIRIAVENAGAQRGCLLLRRGEEMCVEAESAVDPERPALGRRGPAQASDLALSAVNYALRTQDVVLVSDAADDPTVGSDPYIVERRPRSILCVPILKRSRTLGMLYLEHDVADVFTGDRVGVLQGLAAQAAVSLENAALYDQRRRAEEKLRESLTEVERLRQKLEAENTYLQEEIKRSHNFEEIIGESPAIREVLEAVQTVAPTNANVLITGETGTGKELVARALHQISERRDRPLIKVNCATVPKELFESEFFGHVKGAFTGALRNRAGRFELADNGTLFLDEVGEIPIEMQSKLLRVLQEQQFERVGDERTREVDVRIVAATNRDLDEEVEKGRFRQDLYYRLNVFPVHVSPLRERTGDVELLAAHFLKQASADMKCPEPALRDANLAALQGYDWPGNVRELQNVIERAVIASRRGPLRIDLPGHRADAVAADGQESSSASAHGAMRPTLSEIEREHVLRVLDSNDGNKAKTARDLGIDPKTLYKRLREYGVISKKP